MAWLQSSTASTRPSASSPGTVGLPGQRTFFLQARGGVAAGQRRAGEAAGRGARRADRRAARRGDGQPAGNEAVIPAVAPLGLDDTEPLEQPIEEEFRAGTMTLSWDPDDARVVIEVFPFTEAAVVSPDQVDEDFEEPEPDEVLLVRITPGAARAFVKRADAGARGRPARAARSAATRSTPTATCACGRTASGAGTRDRPEPTALTEGELDLHGRIMPASNATFIGEIDGRPGRLQAGRGRAPAVGLPRRHPRRPRGGGVRRLRGDRLEHRAADLRSATARTAPGMVQLWQEPDEEQAAVDIVRRGRGARRVAARLRRRRRPGPRRLAGPRGHPAAAADGGLRRGRQQRRPQGRARAGDARRPPVRRRPRRHLPHRPQAAHRPVGLARGAAHATTRSRRSTEVRDRVGGDLGRTLAPLLTAFEIDALQRRCGRLLATGVLPAPHGEWPAIPWPPF